MSTEIVSLVIAVVGVCGTLASAIVTQRLSLRSKQTELEHAERVRLAEQEAEERQRRTEQLRTCYVRLNANDRNYRDALLAYAYVLDRERRLDEVIHLLDKIIPMLSRARVIMRMDLGVVDKPPSWY